jgi:hypothetical protein
MGVVLSIRPVNVERFRLGCIVAVYLYENSVAGRVGHNLDCLLDGIALGFSVVAKID